MAQRAILHEECGDGAATLLDACLEHGTLGVAVCHGLVLGHLRKEADVGEQVVQSIALERRDVAHDGVAAVLFGHQFVLHERLANLVRINAGLVALVDRHDDLNARSLAVIDGLDGLRHDAVVCSDDQHHDVRHLCTARAHLGERRVARGVDEGDDLTLVRHLIGRRVLRDAASLARGDVGAPDGVEEGGLSVVDVAHDGDDGGADFALDIVGFIDLDHVIGLVEGLVHDLELELLSDQLRGVDVELVVGCRHLAHTDEVLDDLTRLGAHGVCERSDGDRPVNLDPALDGLRLRAGFLRTAVLSGAPPATVGGRDVIHVHLDASPTLLPPTRTPFRPILVVAVGTLTLVACCIAGRLSGLVLPALLTLSSTRSFCSLSCGFGVVRVVARGRLDDGGTEAGECRLLHFPGCAQARESASG